MKAKKIWIGAGVLLTAVVVYIIATLASIKNGLKVSLKGLAIDSFDPTKPSSIPAKIRFKIDNFTARRVTVSALEIEAFTQSGEKLGAVSMPNFRQTYEKKQSGESEVVAIIQTAQILKAASNLLPDGSTTDKLQALFNIALSSKIGQKVKLKGSISIKAGVFPAFRKNFEFEEEI